MRFDQFICLKIELLFFFLVCFLYFFFFFLCGTNFFHWCVIKMEDLGFGGGNIFNNWDYLADFVK